MGDTDLRVTTTSGGDTTIPDYSVSSMVLDESQNDKEFYWYNSKFPQYLGYYKQIPELKKAVDALAMWTAGKGYKSDRITTEIFKLISGWGEDSFDAILQNMLIMKKINGDAYAEIIREDKKNIMINLKPLNPANVRHVTDKKGILKRYDIWDGGDWKKMDKNKILHISNDRIGSEVHGVSVVEACKWVIDARNEAMSDWRKILHRSSVRVIYVDMDDTSTLATLTTQWNTAITKGEVLLIPGKKGQDFEVADYTTPPLQPFLEWIRYLENFFYQAVGIPKIILGGSQEFTEASSKIGYLTFEQVYMTEQRLLEQDIFNQLGYNIEFERPVSLKDEIIASESANTGQTGFQPNNTEVKVGRQ